MEGIRKKKIHSILILAPQPFFQNRGTPIAVKLLAEELAALGYNVHLLVFHEGEEVQLPGVTLHRIPEIWGIKNIPPSISVKKIVCDAFMFFKGLSLVRKHRYDFVHAVEESVFIALVLKKIFGTNYVYDMDSSLAIQIVDKLPFTKPLRGVLEWFERLAVRGSCGVVAVCKALLDIARNYAPEQQMVCLEDISLLDTSIQGEEQLRGKYDIDGPIMLYVGNLEGYQGIDLLLESFQLARQQGAQGNVVIIGGTEESIARYREYAATLGIEANTFFCGPRPVELLGHYLAQANILLSPRIQGNNTPMKLYSYLDAARVVLATDLPTHTQVLTEDFACLVQPNSKSMAQGMVDLLGNQQRCIELGERGREVAQQKYSISSYRKKLASFYKNIVTANHAVQNKSKN